MRVFSRSRGLALVLAAGSVAAHGPMDRLLQTTSGNGLAATAIDAELNFIKNAIDGKVAGWDILSDVVGGSGFKALLSNPDAMKLAVNSDAMQMMSVFPAYDSLKDAVNTGAPAETTGKLFQDTFAQFLESAKSMLDVAKDPSKMMDAVSKVALSDDESLADAYYNAQAGDKDAFDIVAKAVSGDLHPGVDLDRLKALGQAQSMDKVLAMPEVMEVIDMDAFTSKVIREGVDVDALVAGSKAATQGSSFY